MVGAFSSLADNISNKPIYNSLREISPMDLEAMLAACQSLVVELQQARNSRRPTVINAIHYRLEIDKSSDIA